MLHCVLMALAAPRTCVQALFNVQVLCTAVSALAIAGVAATAFGPSASKASDDDGTSLVEDLLDGPARLQLLSTLVALRLPQAVCCASAGASAVDPATLTPRENLPTLLRLLRAADALHVLRYPAPCPSGTSALEGCVAQRPALQRLVPPDAPCASAPSLAADVQLQAGLHAGAWAKLPEWAAVRSPSSDDARRATTPFEMHAGLSAGAFFAHADNGDWLALDAAAVEQRARRCDPQLLEQAPWREVVMAAARQRRDGGSSGSGGGSGADVTLLDAGAGRAPELLRGVASLVRSDGDTRVSAVALELGHVIESLPPSERRRGGIEFVAGNLFEGVPPADVVMLKRVLHAAPDDAAALGVIRAVSRAFDASVSGGTLVVIEPLLPELTEGEGGSVWGGGSGSGSGGGGGGGGGVGGGGGASAPSSEAAARLHARAHLDDVRLMVVGGGRDRTLSEWRALLARGGFELRSVHRAPTPPPGSSAACNPAVLVAHAAP